MDARSVIEKKAYRLGRRLQCRPWPADLEYRVKRFYHDVIRTHAFGGQRERRAASRALKLLSSMVGEE